MSKTYNLEYLFTGGERALQTNDIWEFAQLMDNTINNPDVIQSSIKIYTEEKDGL